MGAKEQIANFFNTCLQCPETFELSNDKVESVMDNDSGVIGQQDMLMAMLAGGG